MQTQAIQTRTFGKTGQRVTLVGLGGEGILRTHGQEPEAGAVITEAVHQGIRYYDCARAYAGSELYYGRVWGVRPEAREQVFQASKSARRTKAGALSDLRQTLTNMHIDHLDLWQIHDVRYPADLREIEGPNGALEGFLAARAAGQTRFVGVTGHHDPLVLTRAVREWPVDAVLLPVNPVEAVLGGFLDQTVPAAKKRGIAVIGMKVLGASHYLSPTGRITAELLIRFALSQPVDLIVVGCSTPEQVQLLADVGRSFVPLTREEQEGLVDAFRPHARQLAYYRGTF
jgi:aryl-alcohol dehydrogenase-like predicted oxidoreductase